MDDEGRPLTEQAGPTVPCPYPDSRAGLPMNKEALQQVTRHWDFILSRARGGWSGAMACLAPALEEDPLSERHAALYKACVGFSQIFAYLLLEDEAPPDDLFAWLERGRWLHGTRQVCAGSRTQIEELYRRFREPCAGAAAPLDFLARQAALALVTYRSADPGEGLGRDLLERAQAPWFYAVTYRPRPPEAALRLSPAAAPLLGTEHLPWQEREALFWAQS